MGFNPQNITQWLKPRRILRLSFGTAPFPFFPAAFADNFPLSAHTGSRSHGPASHYPESVARVQCP